ncbi:hypothetical protein GCM10025883_35840 [Mobilicoccus caccae]|uniref:Esterase n=1 Tax=Mobilicoccus caccae TaxID=1859295 RepID=A0ABQ6IVN1_9MICO|nr:hypothetical protein GCM10025883_35840 [Mobilicoccus caccae]
MFEITGVGTILLAWVLALTCIVVVTRTWGRLARPGVGAVMSRVLAQVLVTVMIVLAVATTVNRSGLWFVSWRDLASVVTGPTGGEMREHGARAAAAAGADLGEWGPGDAQVVASPAPVPDTTTRLSTYTVTGPASGYTGTVHVWAPAADEAPADGRPVLQVFHGYPVSAQSAFANLGLDDVHRTLPGAILLIPDWSPGELDTECTDGPAGKMETWLTTDVPAWAVDTLGARADRGSWATFGYSAGGWCAAMTAMRHPQTYSAAVSLGGYSRPLFSPRYRPFPAEGGAYDLPLLARTDPPSVALLAQYSDKDAVSAPSTRELIDATREPLSVTHWATPDAGHRVGAWKPLVPQTLEWLGRTAPGFA